MCVCLCVYSGVIMCLYTICKCVGEHKEVFLQIYVGNGVQKIEGVGEGGRVCSVRFNAKCMKMFKTT